jgi:hypothetical protein
MTYIDYTYMYYVVLSVLGRAKSCVCYTLPYIQFTEAYTTVVLTYIVTTNY